MSVSGWKADRARAARLEKRWVDFWLMQDGILRAHPEPDGTNAQRAGVDRWLTGMSGDVRTAEEKVRWRPYEGDVLFEMEHVPAKDGREPWEGWFHRLTLTDVIAFAWLTEDRLPGRVFAWDWKLLREAVEECQRKKRVTEIRTRKNLNGGRYQTVCQVVQTRHLPTPLYMSAKF